MSAVVDVRCAVHRDKVVGVIRMRPGGWPSLEYPHLGSSSRRFALNDHGDTQVVNIRERDPAATYEIPCPRCAKPRRAEVGRLLEEWNRRQGSTRRGGVLV